MADTTTSGLTAVTSLASGDLFPFVDVSDTTQSVNGSTRKVTYANVLAGITSLANLATIQTYTFTLTGNFIRSGAHSLTLTTTGATSVTFPTSGTLATVNGALGTPTVTSINKMAITAPATSSTLAVADGKTATVSNTLTFTGTDGSSVAFGTGGTVAYASATVTLSANTDLTRGSHGNRLIIADTGSITLTVLDDTAGSWGSGDAIYGINTSAGTVTLAADATGTTTTVTAETGYSLTVLAGQSFSLSRTAANTWRGGALAMRETIIIPIGDETTAVTTGTAKVTFRMPFAMTVTAVRASLTTASSSGTPTFDINEGGTTILSTKLTVDANELTSTTAATAAVISDSALADDAQITIDVDTAGTSTAGAKIYLIGTRTS